MNKPWFPEEERDEWIPKDQMIEGRCYYVTARSSNVAKWNGKSFDIWRCKWGFEFMDEEDHWDDGAPHGTVKPWRIIE